MSKDSARLGEYLEIHKPSLFANGVDAAMRSASYDAVPNAARVAH